MYNAQNVDELAEELVRKGKSFDEFVVYWKLKYGVNCTERDKAMILVNTYFDAKDEYEDAIGEMSEGLQERISDLVTYIDFIRLKGGKRFTQETIDNLLADNDLKIIDKDSGA